MNLRIKRGLGIFSGLLLLILLSACGNNATTYGSSTGSSTAAQPASTVAQPTSAATTPPKDTSKDYGKGSTTGSTTTTTGSLIKTASATIAGKSVTILTDTNGMTLYYFKPDTASKTACTGGCASTWPPVLFTGSGAPKADGTLPAALEVYPNANGKQVVYNDHPLYTYGGDSAAGQTNGEGIGGNWFVVTPDLAKNQP